MSRYATVETFIWHDEKFRALPEDARTVFLYLLTCPHGNMCGIFYLPDLYAASDLQWDAERYRKAIDTLCDTLLVAKDKDIIWIKNYLKHNPIKGPKQITGAANRLMTLPDTKLIGPFMKNLEKHLLEDDVKLFKELYTKPYDIPIGYPIDTLCDTLCDTPSIADTDTDTDTVSATASEAQAPAETQGDDDDDAKHFVSEVTKEFAVAFGYPPNQTQLEMLLTFQDDGLTEELITEALKRSAEAGAKSPNYTKAILQSWLNKGALTLPDVERLEGTRGTRGVNKVAREDFTYTEPQQDRSMFSFLDDKEDPA